MNHIKLYENFTTENMIFDWVLKHSNIPQGLITIKYVDEKPIIHVNDEFGIVLHRIKEIPFKFGGVAGNFIVSMSYITNLNNFPDQVGGSLKIQDNLKPIDNLIGLPKYVGRDVDITVSELKSTKGLKGLELFGNLVLSYNHLVELEELPEFVGIGGRIGSLYIDDNYLITLDDIDSIEHKPKHIYCDRNLIVDPFEKYLNGVISIIMNIENPYDVTSNYNSDEVVAKRFITAFYDSVPEYLRVKVATILKTKRPNIYNYLEDELNDYINRLKNAGEHKDIIDL